MSDNEYIRWIAISFAKNPVQVKVMMTIGISDVFCGVSWSCVSVCDQFHQQKNVYMNNNKIKMKTWRICVTKIIVIEKLKRRKQKTLRNIKKEDDRLRQLTISLHTDSLCTTTYTLCYFKFALLILSAPLRNEFNVTCIFRRSQKHFFGKFIRFPYETWD